MRRLCAAALFVLGAACNYFDGDTNVYRPPGIMRVGDAASGEELFRRDCAWCHGQDGTGTANGPEIVSGTNGPASADFVLSTGRMPLTDPEQRMTRGRVIYTDEQIDSIVGYVRGLQPEGPEVPDLDLAEAELSEGAVLYQENCAACHSTTGIGGALTEGRETGSVIAPSVFDATAIETAEAVRVGPGTMPVFGPDVIDDEQLDAIVRYVLYLQDPDDEGGAAIGRIGPVAEGAVGWILGLGLLLVFIRWVGTKRGEP